MKRVSIALMAAAVLALAGCSSFDSDFGKQAALTGPRRSPAEGAWVGRWQSNKGHGGGELRAIITPKESAGGVSAAQVLAGRFKAKWGFFTTEYDAEVHAEADITRVSAAKVKVMYDLGFFGGGEYKLDGECTDKKFTATYRSKADEGTVEMTRAE
jgi:hypothetical protein